jgi:hypothetical protein
MRPLAIALAAIAASGCASLSVGGSRYLAQGGPDLSILTVASRTDLIGPLDYELRGSWHRGAEETRGALLGAGADLSIFSGRAGMPYAIGGLEAGLGTRDHPAVWSSWSAGLGIQIVALGPVGLRLEGRYRQMTAEDRRGFEVGLRVGGGWSGRGSRTGAPPRGPALAPVSPVLTPERAGGGDAGALRVAVVELALQAMGTPYRWGGSDADGFDCSGLIQFAYARHGVALPRRSEEQARAGAPVAREPGSLLPGDILTFATRGGTAVTHVGLYLGEGRFIHSATGGVQVSALSPADPHGRWWWDRWVGGRRVIQ